MARYIERLTEAYWYVLKADRLLPLEQQARFQMEPLKSAERMRIWDQIQVQGTDSQAAVLSRSFQQAREIVLTHLIAVENFPIGKPQRWPQEYAEREKYLEGFDDLDVYEIGNDCRERSAAGKTPEPTPAKDGGLPVPATDVAEEAKHGETSSGRSAYRVRPQAERTEAVRLRLV